MNGDPLTLAAVRHLINECCALPAPPRFVYSDALPDDYGADGTVFQIDSRWLWPPSSGTAILLPRPWDPTTPEAGR